MTESDQQTMAKIKENVTALHAVPEEGLYAEFGTSPDGLGEDEILERQNKYGRNILPIRKPPTLAGIFLHQFLSPLIYILLGAGVVSIIIGEATDAVFIFAVILLNAALGTFQEWKAEKSAAALQNLLLWLNLVTNGIQDVALAFEAGEPGAMDKPPRKPAEGIFDKLMIQQTITSGIVIGLISYFTWYWLLNAGWEETAARNMVLLLMVLLENFHVFNARSETVSALKIPLYKNIILVGGVVVAQLIHILSMHLPFMQRVLNVSPVTFREWLSLILLASTVLFVMEIFKFFKFKRGLTEGRL